MRPIFLFALLLVTSANAQLGPEHRFVYPISGAALCVHDVDGDGDGDVVREAGGHLWIMEQVTPGDFRTSDDLGLVGSVDRIRSGDLDGDGIDDLVFNDRTSGSVGWVRVLAGGAFAPLATLVSGLTDVYDVRLADADGDLDLDLFHLSGAGTSTLVWSQNLGGGSFGSGGLVFSGGFSGVLLEWEGVFDVADLDGDGDTDIASLGTPPVWYQNNGSGSFAAVPLTGGTDCNDLVLMDVDGDLDADLVLAYLSMTGSDLLVALNNGSGAFTPAAPWLTSPEPNTRFVGLVPNDMDGDGDLDLLFRSHYGDIVAEHSMAFATNNGGASFTSGWFANLGSDDYRSFAVGDLDGDVLTDVVAYANEHLRLRSGAGSMVRMNSIAPSSISVFDADGDGEQDAAVCAYAPFSPLAEGPKPWGLAFHLNDGAGALEHMPEAPDPSTLSVVRTVPADVDGDGDEDLVAVWQEPLVGTFKHLFLLKNNGGSMDSTSAIGASFFLAFPLMPVTPLLRDLDMDGDTDIFRYTYGDIRINLNSGLGSFGPDISYYLGSDYIPSAVALADMDGDGDPDYVWSHGNMGGGGTDSVFWSPNLGGGVPGANVFAGLSPVQTHNDLGAQNSPLLRSADLNNDGLEDLVVFAGDSIGVLRNGGSGSFLPGQALPATNTYALDIGDLDLDGLPDLVALRQNGDLLFWQNTGGAIFGSASLIATAADHTGTDDVRLADMDGDGIPDVVTCSTNGSAAWLGNNGFPTGLAEHGMDEAFDIRVYPNPTHDLMNVSTSFVLDPRALLVVSDARGRVVHAQEGSGGHETAIVLGSLPAGLYQVRVVREGLFLGVARVVVF